NKQVAAIEADKEMHFNFKLGAMYPSAGMAVEADKEMSSHFVDGIVNIAVLATDAAAGADREVAGHFITANLYVTAADPTAEQVAKADAEMIAAFEKASRPLIGIPSAADAQKADREMLHNYEWQAKLAAVK
ncbi:MAG TPA: hypothetical protein PLL71_15650, partial [Agriterribacter sp.]|nr:hypothetical protein [Agriterribacter sp.]